MNYTLTEQEEKLAKEFKKDHKGCTLETLYNRSMPLWKRLLHRPMNGPYPTKFEYIVTPTGIGTGVDICCNYCGTRKDITDYGSW